MVDKYLYNSSDVANRIKSYAKYKNVVLKDMLIKCDLGSNTMSALYHGKCIAFDSLAKIADYLDCSVDYLLGRTDIVSYKPAPASGELTEHERLVLEAYRSNAAMQSAVDKLLNVPASGISIAEDISETIRKIESVSKADISKK